MDIDQHLKKQLLETPKYLKKYLKDSNEATPGITYYTGNWGQDLEDNLTETQRKKLRKLTYEVYSVILCLCILYSAYFLNYRLMLN